MLSDKSKALLAIGAFSVCGAALAAEPANHPRVIVGVVSHIRKNMS